MLLAIVSLITIAWLVSSTLIYHESKEQVEELFDAELAQLSRMLQAVITANINLSHQSNPQPLAYLDKQVLDSAFGNQEYNAQGHKYEKKLAFQVWDTQGQLFFENTTSLATSFSNLEPGFQTDNTHTAKWRSFTLKDNDLGFWIKSVDDGTQVAEEGDEYENPEPYHCESVVEKASEGVCPK